MEYIHLNKDVSCFYKPCIMERILPSVCYEGSQLNKSFSAASPPTTLLNLQFITIIIRDVEYNNKGSSLCILFLSSVHQNLLIRNMSHLNE